MEGAEATSAVPAPARRGPVIPHRLSWRKRWLASLVYGLIRVTSATLRYRVEDQTSLFTTEPVQPVIYAIWHNRLSLSMMVYRNYPRRMQPSRRLAAIVSASRDGAVVAHILELFGVEPVRGSSSRRGPQALLELTTWAEQGYDLAITPDGPRGPCYVVQDGAIALAQLTGLPVVPVSYHLNWKLRARSWDRFQIPLPFGRCTMRFGQALLVPREASDAERERLRQELENRLRALTWD
jgi:lysophospholipid acyltransferase (LPLAT)-like uncharacterized protein